MYKSTRAGEFNRQTDVANKSSGVGRWLRKENNKKKQVNIWCVWAELEAMNCASSHRSHANPSS